MMWMVNNVCFGKESHCTSVQSEAFNFFSKGGSSMRKMFTLIELLVVITFPTGLPNIPKEGSR